MRKSYIVSQMVKGTFVQKVERFQKNLLAFVEGRGELPTGNIETIRLDSINHSTREMVQGGCDARMAKRISTNVINELMYGLMDDGMMQTR